MDDLFKNLNFNQEKLFFQPQNRKFNLISDSNKSQFNCVRI